MKRILIDECLSPILAARGQAKGWDATHVRFIGRAGYQDYSLMDIILGGDFLFVTNNARDFIKLFSKVDLHNGLVVIIPRARLAEQIDMFEAALIFIEGLSDTVNRLIEVHSVDDIRLSNLPPAEEE